MPLYLAGLFMIHLSNIIKHSFNIRKSEAVKVVHRDIFCYLFIHLSLFYLSILLLFLTFGIFTHLKIVCFFVHNVSFLAYYLRPSK